MSVLGHYRRKNRYIVLAGLVLFLWMICGVLQVFELQVVFKRIEPFDAIERLPEKSHLEAPDIELKTEKKPLVLRKKQVLANRNVKGKEKSSKRSGSNTRSIFHESPFYDPVYEALLEEDERRMVPGLGNQGASVELRGEEKKRADAIMKKEAFNLILSQKIPYNRTLLDYRHPHCKNMHYPEDLPTVSVIIIFTDERWSTLIRTIHSVLNRSPRRYLKEIILVDDFSAHEELKGKLDYYIKTRLPSFVKLYRLPERKGLIRARLKGAQMATSDVLLFLDAHCEATDDWLPPLLARIKQDRKYVVVPIIDVIDDKTFQYENNGGSYDFEVGAFTWSGHFTWIDTPPEEAKRRKSVAHPTRTPTMAGGLFAMDRKYFWEIGSYDEQMDIWGGENLEMSFRIWQCGGILETIPCSRVGHIFRNFHPYKFPGDKDTHGINTARFVRVWWDEYERLFFQLRPDLKTVDIGDITERNELKKRLKCRPFRWFLKHIYNKFIPDEDVVGWGRARTKDGLCLDNFQKDEEVTQNLGMFTCNSELSKSQYFSLSLKGELRREFICAQPKYEKVPSSVELTKCDDSPEQKWKMTQDGLIVHIKTELCLDGKKDNAVVDYCHPNRNSQTWSWENELGKR